MIMVVVTYLPETQSETPALKVKRKSSKFRAGGEEEK